jgi:hypothetical protein
MLEIDDFQVLDAKGRVEIVAFLKNGKIKNSCPYCGVPLVENYKGCREVEIRCCGEIYCVLVNRRANAISRTPFLRNKESFILVGKKTYPAIIIDWSKGGVGAYVPEHILHWISPGLKIFLQYFILGEKIEDEFIVCSVSDNRIGMRYSDGLLLHPKDRVLRWQKKI